MMSDTSSSFETTMAALGQIEAEQKARFAPKPEEPAKTPIEAYAKQLAAARSRWVTVDAKGRLR